MKRTSIIRTIFSLLIICSTGNIFSANRGVTMVSGTYTPLPGGKPTITIYVAYGGESQGQVQLDSFELGGTFNLSKSFILPDNFRPFTGRLYFMDTLRRITDSNSIYGDLRHIHCDGQYYTALFGGSNCTSGRFSGMGTLCLELRFNWFSDITGYNITASGGNWRDEFRIYCDPDLSHIDPRLYIHAPCKSAFLNKPESVHWFESEKASGPWTEVGTGYSVRPVDLSWQKGTRFFNRVRYYKCVVDSHYIIQENNKESNILGPIGFFIGADYDSMFQKKQLCSDTAKDIHIHLKGDSLNQSKNGVRIWIFDHTDPGPLKRYSFIVPPGTSFISLDGKTGIRDPWFGGPSTEGKTLRIKNGLYRIFVDYTYWNGYSCKVRFDSIWVKGPELWHAGIKHIKGESCHGKTDGAVAADYWSKNADDTISISLDGINYFQATDTIKNLAAGQYTLFARSAKSNCTKTIAFKVPTVPLFGSKLNIDTTLCLNQNLFISARDSASASFYAINPLYDTLRTDTFTVRSAGNYFLTWSDSNGCATHDTIRIKRLNLSLNQDFLIPGTALLSDTVWAVNHSTPKPDTISWSINRTQVNRLSAKKFALEMQFSDTGLFYVTQFSKLGACGYKMQKPIRVIAPNDSSYKNSQLGYKGPLIKSFDISPNPHDGQNFTIKVKLREKHNITIFKIDPVSGDITGDIDFSGKDYYEFTAFRSYGQEVYYLKLIAGNESKTIKVVCIP